jgi:hypothetical protein
MDSISNNIGETLGHSAITGGTALAVVGTDHTTAILSVVVQVLALIMLFFKNKNNQTN